MPMRATTVRFSEDLWQLLEGEAARQGISAAQFVREAAIVRVAYLAGQRGDVKLSRSVAAVAEDAVLERPGDPSATGALRAPARLAALHQTGLLDTPAEARFDRLTSLASTVLNAPVALVSLVDHDRQFFKSSLGLEEPWASTRETPLSHSFCRYVVESRRPLVVSDAREHETFRDNPAIGDLGVVSYMGAPLMTHDGHALGALCAIDHQPRHWTREQLEILSSITESVSSEIQLRAAAQ